MADKIIAVVGATGAQGGGLVRAIQSDISGEFRSRAITRNPNSDKAKALAALGAEVVQADIEDIESIKSAFEGAYGAFCVTFFWNHLSPETESRTARNMADSAKAAGVKHVVWSTLEDSREWIPIEDKSMPTLMEKFKVPHFDAKGEADDYYRQNVPATIMRTCFYWDNMIYFGLGPKKGPDGNFYVTFPLGDAKMPGMASEDIGKCALGIFKNPGKYIGRTLGIAGENLSGQDMANKLSSALNIDVKYNNIDPDTYRGFGFPGAEDMGNMFQMKRDFEKQYIANRDIDESRRLNPGLHSFDSWLTQNASKIPLD